MKAGYIWLALLITSVGAGADDHFSPIGGYEWTYALLEFNGQLELWVVPKKKVDAYPQPPNSKMALKFAELIRSRDYPRCRLENEEEIDGIPARWDSNGWNYFISCPNSN